MVGMWLVSIFLLKEGTICVIMLSPIWLVSGMAGTLALEWARGQAGDGDGQPRVYAAGLVALPLVLLPIEASLPFPEDRYRVERSVVIAAPAEAIPVQAGVSFTRATSAQRDLA